MRWLALLGLAAGCGRGADVIDWLRMKDQSEMKVMPYAETPYFEDGIAMRLPPAGTVAHDREAITPPPVDVALLARGRQRFDIVCAACHGVLGDGDTEVARHMALRPPPSLHEPRIRALPPERVVEVIRLGFGLMPSYATVLPPRDRWAVVAYLRALQLSQEASR